MKRYRPTFQLVDTLAEALDLVEKLNATASRYIRQHRPARLTPWRPKNPNEAPEKWVVWYYI